MGQSAEELRAEIEATRTDLGDTMDAIGDRVSPSRMVERRKNRMALGARRLRDRVMGTVHDATDAGTDRASQAAGAMREAPELVRERTAGNPILAGAVALGVGFLVASLLPVTEAEEQAAPQLTATMEPVKDALSEAGHDVVEHLKEPAKAALGEVQDVAQDHAASVVEQAKTAAHDTADTGRKVAEDMKDQARDH